MKLLFGMNTYHNCLHFIGQGRSRARPGSVAWGAYQALVIVTVYSGYSVLSPTVTTLRVPEGAPLLPELGLLRSRALLLASGRSQSSGGTAINPGKGRFRVGGVVCDIGWGFPGAAMHSACGQRQRGNMSSKKKKSPASHQKGKGSAV